MTIYPCPYFDSRTQQKNIIGEKKGPIPQNKNGIGLSVCVICQPNNNNNQSKKLTRLNSKNICHRSKLNKFISIAYQFDYIFDVFKSAAFI